MLGWVGGSQVLVMLSETSQSQMSRAVGFHPHDILKTTKSQRWGAGAWRPGAGGSGGGGGVVVRGSRMEVSGALESQSCVLAVVLLQEFTLG